MRGFTHFIKIIWTAILGMSGVVLGQHENNTLGNKSAHWEFDYKDLGQWTKHYKACGGTHQSPIDLTTGPKGDVKKMSYFPPLVLSGYNDKPHGMNLTNNGHTVVVTVPDGMTASGGCLNEASFHFTQLHFHWGSNDKIGSEHRRNGHQFPIEFHFVHYNNKFGNLNEALDHPDGILVIAVWGELSNGTDNPALAPIIHSLRLIHDDHAVTKIIDEPIHPLRELLPEDADVYYNYQGSLTTPDCHESVTWIIFNETVPISKTQLDEFRQLHQGGVDKLPLVDNFRPLQEVNDRIVELVVSSNAHQTTSSFVCFLISVLTFSFLLK